jgi:hypothetical protein
MLTTHITKDQSEARKAEVPETEALKPCPFCGGKCDPEGWIGDKKRSGPACDDCGSAAETVAIWNTRAAELSAQESKPVDPLTFTVKELNGFADDCAQVGMHGPKMALYQFAAMVNAHGSKPVAWHKPTREDAKKLRESYKSAKTEEGGLDDWLFALEECGFVLVAASVSAQDASPKDGWQIEIVPDPPYPPIVRVRSPEGVARVLTAGDVVLYRYFHRVATTGASP